MKAGTRVLLLGGSGFIGTSIAGALAANGANVTVQTRRTANATHLTTLPSARVVHADPYHDSDLARAMEGHDIVINLIATLHAPFEAAHVELPTRVARHAGNLGVKHVVHFSALGASMTAPSQYLQSKERGEAELHKVADGKGLTTTVLRPSVVFGARDKFLNLFASLARWSPVIPLGSPGALFQPVWVEDVAQAVWMCLSNSAAAGGTWNLVGPRIYTLRELLDLVMRLTGHHRPILPLGPAASMLQATVFEHLPGKLITRDNVLSMRIPNTSDTPFPFLIPHDLEITAARWLSPAGLADPFGPARERAGR